MKLACLILTTSVAFGQKFEERRLATLPESVRFSGEQEAPNGNPATVGVEPVWSVDGTRVASSVYVDGKLATSIGGEVDSAKWDFMSPPVVTAETVIFRVGRKTSNNVIEEWVLLVDGQSIFESAWIGEPSISPDGDFIAFWHQPEAEREENRQYSRTPRLFCVAERTREGGWEVQEVSAPAGYALAEQPAVWRDDDVFTAFYDRTWQLSAWTGRKWEERADPSNAVDDFAVDPKGKRVALVSQYITLADVGRPILLGTENWEVFLDGENLRGEYPSTDDPVFGPKGKLLALRRKTGSGGMGYTIGDGEVLETYDHVHGGIFDPKAKKFSYIANDGGELVNAIKRLPGEIGWKGGDTVVVTSTVKGKEDGISEAYDWVRDLTYSPNGKHFAYCAKVGAQWHLVVNGEKSDGFDYVGPPSFSSDSRTVGFGARKAVDLWWKVLEL